MFDTVKHDLLLLAALAGASLGAGLTIPAPASAMPLGQAATAGLAAPAATPVEWRGAAWVGPNGTRGGAWVGPNGAKGIYVSRPLGHPRPVYRAAVPGVPVVAAAPIVVAPAPVVVAAPRCVWRVRWVHTPHGAVRRSVRVCR